MENLKSDTFHSVVIKLLYVSKRARLDIETAIAFMYTKISKDTQEDSKKLRRLIVSLQRIIDDTRVI